MEILWNKNISALREINSDIADKLLSLNAHTFNRIGISQSRKNGPVPFLKSDSGRDIYFHSRMDPEREAERFVGEADLKNKDLIVVCGFAFAYHCEKIIEQCSETTHVVVIERDEELMLRAFENRDLTGLICKNNLSLLLDPSADELERKFKGKSSRKLSIMTHRGSHQIHGDYYEKAIAAIKSFVSTKDVNIATLAKFEKSWSGNISRNIGLVISSPGVNSFYGKFSGFSAIVVAAGPSLFESLDFIRENADKAVIISVDTAFKVLLDNGIIPHFCMAVDPQLINARYFEGTGRVGTVLVADPTVHPSLFHFFHGRVALTGVVFDLMKWIEDITGHKGEISHGGSVSTNAVDFATRLGVDKTYMVGQDLSFTTGLAHCRGSYLDEQIHNKTYRFKNAQMFNRLQLNSLPGIFLPSLKGGVVRTNQKMIIFKEWFEKQRFENLFNASVDGVVIGGVENVDQKYIELPGRDDIFKFLDNLYEGGVPSHSLEERAVRLKKRIAGILEELESLGPVLEKAIDLSDQLDQLLKSGENRSEQGKVNYILKKLSETDSFVESMKKSKGMISFSIQRVIHTITEGYDLEDEKNAGERSRFMYAGLLDGVKYNMRVLGKMLYFADMGE